VRSLAAAIAVLVAGVGSPRAQTFLNINPSWSPDGRQLVFQSDRHGRTELYIAM
jgi:WD40 repeat protein